MTMQDIIRNNSAAGHYWFSPDTMKFFSCSIETEVLHGNYFITSERGPSQDRRFYTIRKAIDGGREITTIGKFQQYKGLAGAKKGLRIHLEEEHEANQHR